MAKRNVKSLNDLGRRERQIMDIVHRLGEAAVGEVLEEMPDPPSYSSVRTMLRYLEAKGFLSHRRDGIRYVYRPTQSPAQVRRSVLRHLVRTFFNDSPGDAMAALLEVSPGELSDDDLKRLERLIREGQTTRRVVMGPINLFTISHAAVEAFPLLLVEVAIKVTLLALAGYLATWLLGRWSAAVRHRVWTLVFVSLLALPVILVALPGWRLPIAMNVAAVVDTRFDNELQTAPPAIPNVHNDVRPTVDNQSPLETTRTATGVDASPSPAVNSSTTITLEEVLPSVTAHSATPSVVESSARGRRQYRIHWPYVILGIWGVGVLVAISPLAIGRWRCRRIVREGRKVEDPRLQQMLVRTRQELGIDRSVLLYEADSVSVPALCGAWHCVIVLPTNRESWSPSFAEQVLLHELSHVRRWDVATNALARCAAAIYWFHPLVWRALGEMRSLREQACDNVVLIAGAKPDEYAENLLETARRCRQRWRHAGIAMATPSTLERRLIAILDEDQHRNLVTTRFATLSLAAAALVTITFTLPTLRGAVNQPTVGPVDDVSSAVATTKQQPPEDGVVEGPRVSPPRNVVQMIDEVGQLLESGSSDREALRRLREHLTRIGQYAGAFARDPDTETSADVQDRLQQIRRCLDADFQPDPSDELRLHVVGYYEGMPFSATHEQAHVRVTDTSAPLVLCLTAHTPIAWHVSVDEGVDLRQVILGGHDQRVEVDSADTVVADYSYRRGDRFRQVLSSTYTRHADRRGDQPFVRLAQTLHEFTGMDITTFQGGYRAEEEIIVGPESEAWRREHALPLLAVLYSDATRAQRRETLQALRDVTFSFASSRSGRVDDTPRWVGDHTILGPIRGRVEPVRVGFNWIAIDPQGPMFYADGTKRIDPVAGLVRDFRDDPMATVPDFSHVCGVAFDDKRRRLVVATHGGSGLLYACDVDRQSWSLLRDMNDVDLLDITYAASEDVYYGVNGEYLFKYHPDGAILDRLALKDTTQRLTGHPRHETRLADAGEMLILAEIVAVVQADARDHPRRWRVHVLNKKTRKIELVCTMQGLASIADHRADIDALVDEPLIRESSPGRLAAIPQRINAAAALFEELSEMPLSVIRDPESGHLYELVRGRVGVTWKQAREIAEARSYQGIAGHLVTITSAAENRFLTLNFASAGTSWAGGSDEDEEGTWRWVCGPESGQVFWEGNAESGQARAYSAWTPGEPNDMSGGEHYLTWNWASDTDNLSSWNDWDARRNLRAFVVEYSPPMDAAADE